MKKLALLLLVLSSTAFSQTKGNFWYLGALISTSHLKVGNSRSQITYTDITDTYTIPDNSQSSFAGGVRGGYEFVNFSETFALDFGLGMYTGAAYEYNGNLVEQANGDPDSSLYNFRFNIQSLRVMAETQLNLLFGSFAPYISGGVGPAWNTTQQYEEFTSNTGNYPPLPPFKNKTRTSMAWQVGLGVSYFYSLSDYVSPNQRLSIGYQYVNLGQSELGERSSDYPYPLILGAITANEFYLSYTHLF